MLLNRLGLAVCAPSLALVVIGSTVAQDGAVMLHQQNYSETVAVGAADTPLARHFYVATANTQRWDQINAGVNSTPFQTPPLQNGFSGSFILDATATDRSEFAARIADLQSQPEQDGKRLYLGLAKASRSANGKEGIQPELTIGALDTPPDGSEIAFVRFDINEWEVSEGVVSYDIDVSYWGKHASVVLPDETVVAAMEAN
jgi:hypothetical protein